MRTYNIHHVDSFTSQLFGGNPTVAVLGADSLTEEEMRKIAREMNLSETGFVLSSGKADFRLRFFTPPGNEIKFCGHAALGALCAIAREGWFGCKNGVKQLSVETNAGILPMTIDLKDPACPEFVLTAPKIDLVPAPYSLQEVAEALGIGRELVDWTKPLLLEKTNNYLYFTAAGLEALGKIDLDARRAADFAKRDGVIVFCVMAPGAFDARNHLHARGFAPLVGLPEDPFTGSMQGGLAAYALTQGLISPDRQWIGVEQGHFMRRPGEALLEVSGQHPFEVKLHAKAVHAYEAKLLLP
jgi:PhzF family phenazine biosynthesis protein